MKTFKHHLAAIAFGLCALGGGTAMADITNVVLLAGESFTVIGSGADGINVRGSTIDAQGGSTLVFKPTDGTTYVNCWYALQATNGIVTLDVSQDTDAGLERLLRSVYASGTGGFRVKGGTRITVGRSDDGTSAMPFDAADFGFVDNDGNATEGTVTFNGTCCIVNVPTAEKCSWEITSGNIALAGTNALNLADGEPCALPRGFKIFSDTAIPRTSQIQVAAGKIVTIEPSVPAPFGGSVAQRATEGGNANRFLLGDGATLTYGRGLTNFTGSVSGYGTVTANGGAAVTRVPVEGDAAHISVASGLALVVGDGKAATVETGSGALMRVEGGAATLVESWRDRVALWFDPSKTETCYNVGRTTSYDGTSCAGQYDLFYTNRYPLVEAVEDCRSNVQAAYRLRNPRLISNGAPGNNIFPHVYPYLVTNGVNGLSYICCGEWSSSGTRNYTRNNNGTETSVSSTYSEQRRLAVQRVEDNDGTSSLLNVRCVIMVFGSRFGGGAAMFGTDKIALGRGAGYAHALTDPITTNASVSVWVDGQATDPTSTTFNGGWQVVTVSSGRTLPFSGLGVPGGFGQTYPQAGGQCYGEILIFTNVISEVQRVAAERYLAKKWGLAAQYANGISLRAELYGAGTVDATAVDELTLGGKFGGTVTLGGGTLTIPDEQVPYSEATLPSNGRVGWFDPSVRTTVVTRSDNNASAASPDQIAVVWDREATPQTVGAKMLTTGVDRQPALRNEARGIGPAMNWIDFRNFYGDTQGNALRVSAWKEGFKMDVSNWKDTYDAPISTRTAFIVQDSARGGGNPILDKMGGVGDIASRTTDKPSDAIWPSGTTANFTDSTIHLNGVAVVSGNGFTGKPEVFSFMTATAPFSAGFLANYYNTNGSAQNGEIIGEVLFYDREVTGAERLGIEAYLMGKWLGWLPAGYSDPLGATVAGTGTVVAPSAARLPSFAAGFEGGIQVASGDFAYMYDSGATPMLGGSVISAPAATLSLPASCTATVTFATPPEEGSYALVTSAGFDSPVAWTLSTSGSTGGRPVSLRVSGGNVWLDVFKGGLTIIVR